MLVLRRNESQNETTGLNLLAEAATKRSTEETKGREMAKTFPVLASLLDNEDKEETSTPLN